MKIVHTIKSATIRRIGFGEYKLICNKQSGLDLLMAIYSAGINPLAMEAFKDIMLTNTYDHSHIKVSFPGNRFVFDNRVYMLMSVDVVYDDLDNRLYITNVERFTAGRSLESMFNDRAAQEYARHDMEALMSIKASFDYPDPKKSDKLIKQKGDTMKIKDVIFCPPATIVIWKDGTKTVVKVQPDEVFDPEKGLAMAISKRALGDSREYFEPFKKYVGRYYKRTPRNYAINCQSENYMWLKRLYNIRMRVLARDEDGELNAFEEFPYKQDEYYTTSKETDNLVVRRNNIEGRGLSLPQITWEEGPVLISDIIKDIVSLEMNDKWLEEEN